MIARGMIVIAIVAGASSATAAPTSSDAKAAFDRGVAAYTKGDFVAAAAALEQSYKLEPDPDTLFAWAQAERKAGRCDKAIRLYERLLKFELPAENNKAVRTNLEDCRALVPATPPPPAVTEPVEQPQPHRPPSEPRPWWRDPVGDTLVVGGAVGLGVGIAFLVSARSADQEAKATKNYFQFRSLEDTAKSRSQIGIAGTAGGAVLLGAGIAWYALHRGSDRAVVTGWLDGRAGGIAIAGSLD